MRIGARTVCLRWGWDRTLAFCREAGIVGFQVAPKENGIVDWSAAEQREFGERVRSMGLEISATSGGPNLVDPRVADASVEMFKRFLDLAVNLRAGLVCAEVKAVPEGVAMADAWTRCVASVKAVCEYAADIGARYAVEPGPHCLVKDGATIMRLIESVDHPCLGVNYDPANVNSAGADPVADARLVASHIFHTHAKDSLRTDDGWKETVLGGGDVDFDALVRVYREAGYDGWLCIEREASDETADDLRRSRAFLADVLSRTTT